MHMRMRVLKATSKAVTFEIAIKTNYEEIYTNPRKRQAF